MSMQMCVAYPGLSKDYIARQCLWGKMLGKWDAVRPLPLPGVDGADIRQARFNGLSAQCRRITDDCAFQSFGILVCDIRLKSTYRWRCT